MALSDTTASKLHFTTKKKGGRVILPPMPLDRFYMGDGCKKAPSFEDVFTKEDLTSMRQYYEMLLKDYPDVLNVRQVAQFTGYGESSVAKWCSKQELKSFLIRQKFKIPKEYLLDFFVSRYFIGIAVKSEKHQKFNEKIRKLCEVSSEE